MASSSLSPLPPSELAVRLQPSCTGCCNQMQPEEKASVCFATTSPFTKAHLQKCDWPAFLNDNNYHPLRFNYIFTSSFQIIELVNFFGSLVLKQFTVELHAQTGSFLRITFCLQIVSGVVGSPARRAAASSAFFVCTCPLMAWSTFEICEDHLKFVQLGTHLKRKKLSESVGNTRNYLPQNTSYCLKIDIGTAEKGRKGRILCTQDCITEVFYLFLQFSFF